MGMVYDYVGWSGNKSRGESRYDRSELRFEEEDEEEEIMNFSSRI